ncbi:MAG: hypothetical protein B5766_09340 [Candidatus Lumbricidophila eiseniae]|uniref:DUF2599 domain-containing protein n=1 Tax=Candidatus Lumbricidiphila eiseniae TaxID=1969409 RepID=A0A2A6FPH3_9MICO|nr:MAG: hypothetical protein B5766_09340 [Candidatus Lumbricidophila eiseniae]
MVLSGFLAAGALALGVTSPAGAEEELKTETGSVLAEVTSKSTSRATEVLNGVANVSTDSTGDAAIDATVAGTDLIIPTDPSDPITVKSHKGDVISVELPFADKAADAVVVADGVVAFDNRNASTTAAIAKGEGSLQVVTIIDSASAPTRYVYEFNLPEGAEVIAAGTTLLFIDDGKLFGGLAPAWAKDSAGRDVPTRYEVTGATITQVVEHVGGEVTYPVVADPWIGLALFQNISVAQKEEKGQPVVNLDLSGWGWAVYIGITQGGGAVGFAAGQAILNTAGWDEAWSKGGRVRRALDKPSQRQQFSCHALGALAAGTWNLEKYRPNRIGGDWWSHAYIHHCNWNTSYRE